MHLYEDRDSYLQNYLFTQFKIALYSFNIELYKKIIIVLHTG